MGILSDKEDLLNYNGNPVAKKSYRFFYQKPYVNCEDCMSSRLKCDKCLKNMISRVKYVEEQNKMASINERREKLQKIMEKKMKMLQRDNRLNVFDSNKKKKKRKKDEDNNVVFPVILDQNILHSNEHSYLNMKNFDNNNSANINNTSSYNNESQKQIPVSMPTIPSRKTLGFDSSNPDSSKVISISKEVFIPKVKSPMLQRKDYLSKLARDLGMVNKTQRVIDLKGNSFYSPPLKLIENTSEERK
jgi:hypothetical protein